MDYSKSLKAIWPYLICGSLRVILTCIPQFGYIHPDEFFQSIEVIAEKALEVEVNKPWEFNATFPIRSVVPQYLVVGLSFQLLKNLNLFLWRFLHTSIITPYFVVVFPRLLFCCLSFTVDWCLYKICVANGEKYKSRCLILATSYVIVIYATRTFSNTIELLLFALLLHCVSESVIFSTIHVRQREYVDARYKKAKTTVERAKFHKLRLFLQSNSLQNCFLISTITVAGFFNRPTFAAYAIAPIFFWLYRGLGFRSISSLNFHWRITAFVVSAVPTILLFILIDSLYFGYLTWGEVGVLKVSINNFVVTPLNFIKYNINPRNLAMHGLHPRYVHVGINVPLLFGLLGVIGYYNVLHLFSCLVQGKYNYLPTVRSIRGLMTSSFLTPLLLLSIFPHQEPRFLLPLILPLVYLYGLKILPEKMDVVVKSTSTKKKNYKLTRDSYILFKIWLVMNALLIVFYGFIHQGGIYPVAAHLNRELKRTNMNYRVVTSHVYSMPRFLLLQNAKKRNRMVLYEEGSNNLENVLDKIEVILGTYKHSKVYLIIPTSLLDTLDYYLNKYHESNLILNNALSFYPHVSVEALPQLNGFETFLRHPVDTVTNLFKSLGLARLEFKLKTV